MNSKDAIKEILEYRGLTQSDLGERIEKSQSNVTGYLNRGKNEMRIDIFITMLNALGFELVAMQKDNPAKRIKLTKDSKY